ncbi:hypothetical protein EVAR_12260_1 [Eumeta japonica]|uniref:Uncharacterized protein n=1 Tax=Eumeta variegata TaxID=151549 RepID=A0A4C1TU72_EUMVA|nr:hypothetical protein EVAR_12260_1 [Eumeta japonica]
MAFNAATAGETRVSCHNAELSYLMTHIYNELNRKKIRLTVGYRGGIRQCVVVGYKECVVDVYGMVMDYLRDREVTVLYAGGEFRNATSNGCIQDSIARPSFWNLVLNSRLQELGDLSVYVPAFTDDAVLMFSGQSP